MHNRERALISDYSSLCSDFGDLESVFPAHGKEKENLEKSEHEKAQRFRPLLHTKLHGVHRDLEKSIGKLSGQCFKFPNTCATVGNMLDWFRTEVRPCPTPSLRPTRILPIT
jgi:hypothetical protein